MPDVHFTARNYLIAAQEHLGLAAALLRGNHYSVAHYFAGVAVECILRAHSVSPSGTFDSSHSIEYWARKSNLLPGGTEEAKTEFRAALDEVNARWRANQRYMTAKMMDAYLHSTGLDKIRGDKIKYSSKRLFELANSVVEVGVEKWKPRPQSG